MKSPLATTALAAVLALVTGASPAHPAVADPPDTLARIVPMAPIEVSTTRTTDRSPVAHSTLGREQVRRLNTGQDTPMALATLPGAYAYSDAGNGIGYSYLTLRGFPQRRISVLFNGVPLNDPESHEVYWIDHPDILASTSELTIARGAGPALYGAAALGGSVMLTTAPIGEVARGSAEVSSGAFGTRRIMLEGESGILPGGWGLHARYSRIETDGYRDQSWSKLWSYSFSALRTSVTQSWRLNLYGGPENTHLAYLGVPQSILDGGLTGSASRDRRFNPLTYPGEQDHFFEPHYELLHTWSPAAKLTLSQTLFWFDGNGFYDEQRFGQDLSGYRLAPWATLDTTLFSRSYYATDAQGNFVRDSLGRARVERADIVRHREITDRHFGWVPRARFEHAHGALTFGGELRFHDGHHVGSVIGGDALPPGTPPGVSYYDYHPRTLSSGLFAREEWDASRALRITADIAWRHQGYAMRDDRFDGIRFDQSYDFALPRLGVSWAPRAAWNVFASYALASREPAFRDLFDGEGVGGVPLLHRNSSGTWSGPLVRPEHVGDAEFGAGWRGANADARLNLYRMDFRDELVYAGQFDTDLGYPILGNAARSVHQGAELEARTGRTVGAVRMQLEGNASLSDNHFIRYREQYGPGTSGEVSYDGKALGFFPATTAHLGARVAAHGAELGAAAHYTGRIYVDNTESRDLSIAPHTVLDMDAALSRPVAGATVALSLRVTNVTERRYATSGYLDVDPADPNLYVPYLVPAATRGWLAGMRVSW